MLYLGLNENGAVLRCERHRDHKLKMDRYGIVRCAERNVF